MPASPPPMAEFDLGDPASYLSAALQADLIMKGGITSGLVYPLAASRLATRYRFRSVGGASAGAIAAGLTVAAEYRRRTPRKALQADAGAGYVRLTAIPGLMGAKLSTLFVPAPPLRRVYEAMTAWMEPTWSFGRKALASLRGIVTGAPLLFALPQVLLAGVGFWSAWPRFADGPIAVGLAAVHLLLLLIVGLVLGVTLAAVKVALGALRALPANGFGFCNGLSGPGADPTSDPALTEWLSAWLDDVAGLAPNEGPLTFGHLYGAAASRAYRELKLDTGDAAVSPAVLRTFSPDIDLQLMTTCLSWGRPYAFPFRTRIFHYCPSCWQRYFPQYVLQAMEAKSHIPASLGSQTIGGQSVPISTRCAHHPDTDVRALPSAPDMPVVVGIRMSLSFPVLLSAIPIQTVDRNRRSPNQSLVELWFSDGGITSNFPVHFFDAMLPTRPTFAINLADKHPDQSEMVYLPATNAPRTPRFTRITSVIGLLKAVFNTAQSWVDGLAITAPGFRDRVVEVRTNRGEGGLNLRMAPPTIQALSDRGDEAARKFEQFDFDNHRWVRYRTAMGALTTLLEQMRGSFPGYEQFLEARTPNQGSYAFPSRTAKDADLAAARAVMATAADLAAKDYPAIGGPLPRPRPILRPVPPQ